MRTLSRAEGWQQVYEAYQQINFSAFDYQTVKQSLLDYIKEYFPENFNDYIEDSELIAILELFAYISELFAYRLDMNAHENFIGTAQRKQSVLRLSQLISYTPSRNTPARGLVKVNTISTTESVFDSRGTNLANKRITWNDSNNSLWKEQFFLVMNRVLEQQVGSVRPEERIQVDDVVFELYSMNNQPLANGVIGYNITVNGSSYPMELVPSELDALGPHERRPERNAKMYLMYAYDGIGDASDNTGFFFFTKQGSIQKLNRNYDGVTPYQSETIELQNINKTDVWVNNINPDTGEILTQNVFDGLGRNLGLVGEWDQVDAVNIQNIAFNTNVRRNKYQVETLENDTIRIVFGDGEFADIPNGSFDIWVRQSANENFVIPESAIDNKTSTLSYVDDRNIGQTFTFTFAATSAITNATTSEDIESIRRLAPSVYYTQNRMVNGHDYNTYLLRDNSIFKIRAINRTFAGDSNHLSWNDPSGRYQDINHPGEDLIVYYETNEQSIMTQGDETSRQLLVNAIQPYLTDASLITNHLLNGAPVPSRSFSNTELDTIVDLMDQIDKQSSTGVGFPISLGYVPTDQNGLIFVQFDPGLTGTGQSTIGIATGTQFGITISYYDGNDVVNGKDIIIQGDDLDTIGGIISALNNKLNPLGISVLLDSGNLLFETDTTGNQYFVKVFDGAPDASPLFESIASELSTISNQMTFSIDTEIYGTGQIPRWIPFSTNEIKPYHTSIVITKGTTENWDVVLSFTNMIAESPTTNFWFNNENETIINASTFQPNRDVIKLLAANLDNNRTGVVGQDQLLYILANTVESDNPNIGLTPKHKLIVTPEDTNGDLTPDNVLLANFLDMETILSSSKEVSTTGNGFVVFELPTTSPTDFTYCADCKEIKVVVEDNNTGLRTTLNKGVDYKECAFDGSALQPTQISHYIMVDQNIISNSDPVYAIFEDFVYFQRESGSESFNYTPPLIQVRQQWFNEQSSNSPLVVRRKGRDELNFFWKHHTPRFSLVNPSPTNINDIFVLTKGYYYQFTNWVDNGGLEPVKPSPFQLNSEYGYLLSSKMQSDSIVLNSGNIKILFGKKADSTLRAKIKVIKSETTRKTDNQVKSEIIEHVRNFFDIQYWEFGETFYFSELATVIQGKMHADVKSVVLVPLHENHVFGDLYEVIAAEHELFYPDIKTNDIDIVSSLTPQELKQIDS